MDISNDDRVGRDEASLAVSRPERARSSTAVTNPLWIRFPSARSWCFAVASGDSYVTACSGQIAVGENVDPSAEPPRSKRCPVCERHRIVASVKARIEPGLRELRDAIVKAGGDR